MATRRFLRFKVSEAVRLGVLDAGVFHGGFPADALLACGFDLVETSAFGGFAAEGDLLCDRSSRVAGGVGPFACPVRLAAADDEAEAFGWDVVEAGDPDPGVLLGVGEFLLGGDVLGPVLFLEDEEPLPRARSTGVLVACRLFEGLLLVCLRARLGGEVPNRRCEPHGVPTRCGRHDTHERNTPLGGLNTELRILRRVLQHGVAVASQRLRALRLGWISITSRNRRDDRRESGAAMEVGGTSPPASISDGRQVGALEVIRNKRLARVEVDVNSVGAGPELDVVWTEHGAGRRVLRAGRIR